MIHAWPLFGRAFARSQASIERIADFARQAMTTGVAPNGAPVEVGAGVPVEVGSPGMLRVS